MRLIVDEEFYYWIGGAITCVLVGWSIIGFIYSRKKRKLEFERDEAVSAMDAGEARLVLAKEHSSRIEVAADESKAALELERSKVVSLTSRLATADERNRNLEISLASQKKEVESLQARLMSEFENLANRILADNSKNLVVRNKDSMDKILAPLGENIDAFRKRIDQAREADIRERASFVEQLKSLKELNNRMSEDAQNLTSALKGQVKTQGNWGELILERVLERSGLVEGREYSLQVHLKDESGKRYLPDVVMTLPDQKNLIVDSKVSLVAYERHVSSELEAERSAALKGHIESLKKHVVELSEKKYDSLLAVDSPDFVLMFVPIEAAVSAAVAADDSLFDYAFRRNVVLVTPSTLLIVLRTVSNLWVRENQAKNALEIARRSGDLYDKFVGFYEDLQEVGKRLDKSQDAYSAAMNKLRDGKGSLVGRVEQLKELGAQAKKSIPQ